MERRECNNRARLAVVVVLLILIWGGVEGGSAAGGHGKGRASRYSCRASGPGQRFTAGPLAMCTACGMTTYKSLCQRSFASLPGAATARPPELVLLSVHAALDATQRARTITAGLLQRGPKSQLAAVRDCAQLLSDSADQLARSATSIARLRAPRSYPRVAIENALVWTSAALTFQNTCADGLRSRPGPAASAALTTHVGTLSAPLATNALDLIAHLGHHLCSWQEQSQGKPPFNNAMFPAC